MSNQSQRTATRWNFDSDGLYKGTLMASETVGDMCDPYITLTVPPADCNQDTSNPLHIEAQWLPIKYETEEEFTANGFEQLKLLKKVVKQIHGFEFVADEHLKGLIYKIAYGSETLTLTDKDLVDFTIHEITVKDTPVNEEQDLFIVTVTFKTSTAGLTDFGASGCCLDLYTEAPYEDPCTGQPGDDPDCTGITFAVTRSGNDLQAIVTGDSGSWTVQWQYREQTGLPWQSVGSGTPLTLGGYGEYKGIFHASNGTCILEDTYTYLSPCSGFSVDVRQSASTLIANITGGTSTFTYKWYQWNDVTESWDLMSTSAVQVITVSGIYQVEVTDSNNCVVYDTINALIVPICTLDFTLARVDNELQISAVSEAGYSVQWTLNDGSTITVLPETGDTINLETYGQGLYTATVTKDACSKDRDHLVLDQCMLFKGIIYSIEPVAGGYARLQAASIYAPGTVDFTWYQNTGSGWVQVGTGNTIDLNTSGTVRLVSESGICSHTDEISFCVDPAKEVTYQRINAASDQSVWPVTVFTLPDPGSLTDNEISAQIDVYVNQVHLVLDASAMNGYQIDYANNEIETNQTWPAGSVFEIIKK